MTLEVPIKIFTDIEKKWEMRRKKPNPEQYAGSITKTIKACNIYRESPLHPMFKRDPHI